jgi:ligand-binding sensor domain-containing protein/two-component sensor histidine kinase
MKLILLLLACAAYPQSVLSQTLPNRRYTTRDGLVADRITVITQDQDGFMWMGSLFGLSRYDGSRFTTITLPASQQYKYVTSLLAADNKVYAGFLFGGGLMQYDKGKINAYFINSGHRGSDNDVVGLFDDGNGILVLNSINEVYRFHNAKFQLLFSLDKSYNQLSVTSLASDAHGRIWVGTSKGLLLYDKGKLQAAPLVKGPVLYLHAANNAVNVMWTEGNRTLFGSVDHGLRGAVKLETSYIAHISFAGRQPGEFWGVQAGRGLFNMDSSGQMQFYESTIRPSTEIKYLFADRENNLWLATDPGVLKISNIPAISYEFDELAPGGSDITRTADSVIWCTNSVRLYRIENNSLQKADEFRDKQDAGYIGSVMADDQNYLWICGWNKGLWRLKYEGTRLVQKQYLARFRNVEVNANCMVRDEHGNIWAAGNNGIFLIQNGEIKDHFVPIGNDGQPAFITALAIDTARHELWAGENTSGVIRILYDFKSSGIKYWVIDHLHEKDGLTDTYVRSLLFDSKNNLWIGTRLGGIFRMRMKDANNYWITHYGAGNGINCTRVTDIAEEKGVAAWFATCDGVFRFSLSSETWESYNVGDGLLSSEVFALSIDAQGKHVWAVTGQGITDMRYAMKKQGPPPQINITQVSILGKPDTAALLQAPLKKLSSSESSIGFLFAGASYTDERKIRYKYMLEGYDKDWSEPVQENSVNYASLPFGHYTFKVLASNGEQWSTQPATFSFEVVRPFYKSFWFIALITCMVAASFYFIRIYRLKQKLKVEKLRVNIARDLHDDIGSALGSINLLSENATRRLANTKSVEEVAGVFQKIGYSAQSMLDSMDDIIWTINPEKDSLEDLLIRMREFAIPLLEAKNITFSMDMNAADGVKPSMEIKRNIYLVFKESIFNIVRHSGSSHVDVKAQFTQRSFDLSIADNGKGFNINTLNGRNGLKNMRKRADLSGATLQIDSAPGVGTTIRFHGIIR